jgi:hypothetical protein
MMQAESLHREAAFLSNKLHTFDDSDVDGVKPIIDQIREKRTAWKECRLTIAYFERFGKLPSEERQAQQKLNPQREVELRYELGLINTAIWKFEQKMKEKPESSRFSEWTEKLAKSNLRKKEITEELLRLKYETA